MWNRLETLDVDISLCALELRLLNAGLDDCEIRHQKISLIKYIHDSIGAVAWKELHQVMQQLVAAISAGRVRFEEFKYVRESLGGGGLMHILMSFYRGTRSGDFPNVKYTRNSIEESNYSSLQILLVVLQDPNGPWYSNVVDLVQKDITSAIGRLGAIPRWTANVDILNMTFVTEYSTGGSHDYTALSRQKTIIKTFK